MKPWLILILLLALSTGLSCDNGGPAAAVSPIKATTLELLDGQWNLVHISGGFIGVDQEVAPGQILWTFDSTQTELTVVNSQEPGFGYAGLPSGTYEYHILAKGDGRYLILEGEESGGIFLEQDRLVIDGNERSEGSGADLFILSFQR